MCRICIKINGTRPTWGVHSGIVDEFCSCGLENNFRYPIRTRWSRIVHTCLGPEDKWFIDDVVINWHLRRSDKFNCIDNWFNCSCLVIGDYVNCVRILKCLHPENPSGFTKHNKQQHRYKKDPQMWYETHARVRAHTQTKRCNSLIKLSMDIDWKLSTTFWCWWYSIYTMAILLLPRIFHSYALSPVSYTHLDVYKRQSQ